MKLGAVETARCVRRRGGGGEGVAVGASDVAGNIVGEGSKGGLGDGTETGLLHLKGALPKSHREALGPELLEREG